MTREQIIRLLVHFDQPIEAIEKALIGIPWDWDGPPLAILSSGQLQLVMERKNRGELDAEQIERWANLIECREDIEVNASVAPYLLRLANPDIG